MRGLALLDVNKSVDIGGFYARCWPRYLEDKMGLKVVNKDNAAGSEWERMLRKYQRGTERLDPWGDAEDGWWDVPRGFLSFSRF